ncbi:unnamed protein product [Orchesella dallaii]|uniref:Uncharacterized protein n=1 Tax=Orchesella dallaii TaxID=48710 RepID=A0ABP1R9B4_9HEXA
MTNTTEEVTATLNRTEEEATIINILMMMPSRTTCEAPAMQFSTSSDSEQSTEENEWVVTEAAGNVAKAARKVGYGLRRTSKINLRTSNSSQEAEHDKDVSTAEDMGRDTTKVHNRSYDDVDNYDLLSLFNEEEDGAYKKTCSSSTLSQSVRIIQPEEQPKSPIATIGLFLVLQS